MINPTAFAKALRERNISLILVCGVPVDVDHDALQQELAELLDPVVVPRPPGDCEDRAKTLSVPEAGKVYFDLGRNASYRAAASGELPTIKIGRRVRVPVRALEEILQQPQRRRP